MPKDTPTITSNDPRVTPEPIYCECGGDYTLPDYLPDIRRVLTLSTRIAPTGEFLGGEKAEFAGSCLFTLLYLDPAGKVASFSAPYNYECAVPLGMSEANHIQPYAMFRMENATYRLTGPRRVNFRGIVSAMVKLWSAPQPATLPLESREGYEILESTQPCRVATPFSCAPSRMHTALSLEGTGTIRLLSLEGNVMIGECTRKAEEMVCRGDIRIGAVCVGEDGIPYSLHTKIPFEETLPKEDASEVYTTCHGYLTTLEGDVSENENGASLLLDMVLELRGCHFENKPMTVVRDVFSLHHPCHVTYKSMDRWESMGVFGGGFTLDGSCDRTQMESGDAQAVAATYLSYDNLQCTYEGSKIRATATAHLSMLVSTPPTDDSGVCGVNVLTFEHPLQMELNTPQPLPADCVLEGALFLAPPHGRLDPSKLFFDCEAYLSVEVHRMRCMDVVDQLTPDTDHPFPPRRDMLIATYLRDGDSLWDIAKRYHTSPAQIAKCNHLPSEVLEQVSEGYGLDGYVKLLID